MVSATTCDVHRIAPPDNTVGAILKTFHRVKDLSERLARLGIEAGGKKAETAKFQLEKAEDFLASACSEVER